MKHLSSYFPILVFCLTGLFAFSEENEGMEVADSECLTYLEIFKKRSAARKSVFEEAKNSIGKENEQSPVIQLIECLWQVEETNYPRALHHLNNASTAMTSQARYSSPKQLESGESFLWQAHLTLLKAELNKHMGRRGQAIEHLRDFHQKKHYDHLGLGEKSALKEKIERRTSLVLRLCSKGRFPEADSIAINPSENQEELSELELTRSYLDQSRIIYFKTRDSEKAFQYLSEAKKKGSSQMSEMARLASLHGDNKFSEEYYLKRAGDAETSATSTSIYEQKLSKLYLGEGRWEKSLQYLEKAWTRSHQKDNVYRYVTDRSLKISVAEILFLGGYLENAGSLVDEILSNPLRWGGTGSPIQHWFNRVYLIGIGVREGLDENLLLYDSSNGWLENLKGRAELKGKTLLWRQAVRANVANLIKEKAFIRDAMHLSGSPPWMWHLFISTLGPRQTEILLKKYPLVGKRKELFNNYVLAEIAYLKKDWKKLTELARKASSDLQSSSNNLLKARVDALRLKADFAQNTVLPNDLRKEVYDRHPLALVQLDLPLPKEVDAKIGQKNKQAFQVPQIKVKDIEFLTGKSTRTITPR
jgi:hypothetical protein